MKLPGCPNRRVTAVADPREPKLRGHGVHLKLECGHEQWLAGNFDTEAKRDMLRFNFLRPCLSGCYRHQRFMGS